MAAVNWHHRQWSSIADGTAIDNSTSEESFLAGLNDQPAIEAFSWMEPGRIGRRYHFEANGVLSNTGTPGLTLRLRLGTTAGVSDLTGTVIGATDNITTTSGVTNVPWRMSFDFTLRTFGIGAGNLTMSGIGFTWSGQGYASPFQYDMIPSQGSAATFTTTYNGSSDIYVNFSGQWDAASASNTITCKNAWFDILG